MKTQCMMEINDQIHTSRLKTSQKAHERGHDSFKKGISKSLTDADD